jgi:protein SDA1
MGGPTTAAAGGGSSSGGGGGSMSTGAGTKMDVTLKLPQLQNLCKRDPVGYREDYDAQVRRLESECGILLLSPQASPSPRLIELIQFAAAVSSSSYKGEESDRIAMLLINLLVGQSSSTSASSSDAALSQSGGGGSSGAGGPSHKPSTVVVMAMPTAALQLHREVRKTCVSALILMRNKGVVEPLRLLELFFRLMAVVPDKALREVLYLHIINDIRNINKKGKRDEKVNRAIQSFLHRVVSTNSGSNTNNQHHPKSGDGGGGTGELEPHNEENATDIAAKRATDVVCELYRRRVWTDDRTVAILASAVQSNNQTVMCRAMRFFLQIEEKMARDDREAKESEWDASQKVNVHKFSKKTKARERDTERQTKARQKKQKQRESNNPAGEWIDIRDDQGVESSKKLYPAIELLRDPQGLAEAVLKRLKTPRSIPYNVKLLMMNFVTRLVGNHELLLLNLYPFLQKYMGGHQRDVTAVLAYTVQACHQHVPPDEVYGILKTIAHNFITERCSEEQMAVGINAVRAICARVPSALSMEESKASVGTAVLDVEAFARDMAGYATHRDRSVSIAGKGWMNFIRETFPSLLAGKDRGLKGTAMFKNKTMPMRYGEQKISSGVEGADLLVEYESKKKAYLKRKRQEEEEGDKPDNDGDVDGEEEEEEGFEEMEDDEEEEDFDEEEEEEIEMEDSDEDAPELVALQSGDTDVTKKETPTGDDSSDEVIDLSKMTKEEREKLKQQVSSTRVFGAADFERMRKLVEREERAKRDPREAARRKRAIALGKEFEELSGDDSDDEGMAVGGGDADEEDDIRIAGAVNPADIMASAKRKRQSKAEKLQKIIAGREKFESKQRAGGSTNIEKKRRKNFMMVKASAGAAGKSRGKSGTGAGKFDKKGKQQIGHLAKKRRRKM